jgi:aspartyl/asparaginyl beta-hydroxylase (cupin superfamily)
MPKSIKMIDINREAQRLADKTRDDFKPLSYSIFTLCNKCLWSATYFDKTRLPHENRCPLCVTNKNELSSLPITAKNHFAISYDAKRGLEIEFRPKV